MPDTIKKKLGRATLIYWLLLIYIVAAYIWWFISLERQNDQMRDFKIRQLDATVDSNFSAALYRNVRYTIDNEYVRNRTKFAGEGIVFLAIIFVGAAFVYRSVRRQFRLQQQQQNFMMAVTHELKTPIAVARLNLETLQKHTLDPEKQKKLIKMTHLATESPAGQLRQSGQVRLSGQRQPRDPYPDERRDRHQRTAARHRAATTAKAFCPADPHLGGQSPDPDQ